MALRRCSIAEMITVTFPWVTPGHPERLLLEALAGTTGLVRFAESIHAELIASQDDPEPAVLSALTNDLGGNNLRHDDLARFVWYSMTAYRHLQRGTPDELALESLQGVMFPTGLKIVHASYHETAGQAEVREAQLTGERKALLAGIPAQGGTLLDVVHEWNRVGMHIGRLANQRATPVRIASERVNIGAVRDRWVRVVKTVLDVLELEANDRPEARRLIDRVASIQADVRRRLRASSGGAPGGDDTPAGDGDDDEALASP
jgi:hypothetical protein